MKRDKKADWTFMIYMAGDNNLSTAGDKDLEELRQVGSTERVNLVVEFDNAGNHGTRRFHIRKDGKAEPVETLGETDSGDPDVLSSFIRWASREYPAERYALVLWNHGSGWAPLEVDRIARSVGAPDCNEREIAERSSSTLNRALFRSTLERVFALPTVSERAICSDDGSGHSLDTLELERVIALATDQLGQKLDLLGMDACLMNNIEVAYQVRDHVRYIVASEENEPADGWPYNRIMARLTADPSMDTAELASHIVTDYVSSYVERSFSGDITQAAIDVAHMADLTTPLDDLSGRLLTTMTDSFPAIWKSQRKAARFWHNTLWDIGHFCQELERHAGDPQVQSAARAVWDALTPGDGRPLVAEGHCGDNVQFCRGSSIYMVSPLKEISRYYEELAFAADFGWMPMLRAYHEA